MCEPLARQTLPAGHSQLVFVCVCASVRGPVRGRGQVQIRGGGGGGGAVVCEWVGGARLESTLSVELSQVCQLQCHSNAFDVSAKFARKGTKVNG